MVRYKRKHRRGGETLACRLMRGGLLDVCLDCGEVYTYFNGRRRRRRLQEHYKGYLWVKLYVEDHGRRPNKSGRRRWGMSAWVHRLAYMKKRAIEEKELEFPETDSTWRDYVEDLPPTLDIDHDDTNRHNNRGWNLVLRTHAGNSGRQPITPEEELEVEREVAAFAAA